MSDNVDRAGRKTKLDQKLIKAICKHIRAGCFDYIACEAVGIGQRTFYDWLADAEKVDADPLKVQFSQAIARARAEARQDAEARVFTDKPDTWLLRGPGRERPGRPGWASENTVNLNPGEMVIRLTWADENTSDPD